MQLVDVWGWTCAVVGSFISLPQVLRLLRAHTSAGISLLMWQLSCAASVAWVFHGLRGDWWNITIPNALIVVTGVLIMNVVISDRHLDPVRTWGLVAAVAAALVAVEYLTTPALFGAAVLIPLAIGMLGQTRDLLRAPNLGGVSGVYLGLVALIQYMWLSWGIAVGDVSIVICATVLGVISGFNLVWFVLRDRGRVAARPRLATAGVA